MADVGLGLVAILVGAGLTASLTGEGFLATVLGWLVGLVVAALFGVLAYLYYEVSVLIAMSAIGFTLGTTAMVALGVTWSWLIVLVGVMVGALLALIAIVADLPMVLLTVLTAGAGATAIIIGVMLVVGVVSIGDLGATTTTADLVDDWWWYVVYAILTVAGIVAQLTATARMRGSLRNRQRPELLPPGIACRVGHDDWRRWWAVPHEPIMGRSPSRRSLCSAPRALCHSDDDRHTWRSRSSRLPPATAIARATAAGRTAAS